ncbi:SDR family NAD(P)-dependent oxidoreductase [Actinomycetaceae bacterium MB13-C1-2]|nr:SDR family NAD(P)-dependent oxidoreductase [Actinomycetaceae bacterium MB13-C1-2]
MPVIAVFGAGPGLGRSVARKFGQMGYQVVLVARTQGKLDALAAELSRYGIRAYPVAADLSKPEQMGDLAERIREVAGDPEVIYYAPTSPEMTFVPATELTGERVEATTSILLTSLVELVQQFLPSMMENGRGAILTAQGATALTGVPKMSGPGPAMAAQRNYLQALGKELEPKNVFVGRMYISSLIENSAIHQTLEKSGKKLPDMALVNPDELAEKLWRMQEKRHPHEVSVPALSKLYFPLTATAPVQKIMARFAK